MEARGGDLGAKGAADAIKGAADVIIEAAEAPGARDGGLGDGDRGLFSLEEGGGSEGAGRLGMQTLTCFS